MKIVFRRRGEQINSDKMGWVKKVKQFLKTFDFFAQPANLRFDGQPDYESATGGFCSIVMIIIFIAIFTGTAINTFNKVNVESLTTLHQITNPTYYTVGSDKFMFAISLLGFDMNSGDRWFDIYMQFRSYGDGMRNKTYVPLVACEKEVWTEIDESFGEVYDRLGFDSWLCPENGSVFQLEGKFTSEYFKFYKFAVTDCDPARDPSRPCVADQDIEDFLNDEESFNFNFYFVNSILNGGSHEYITYYLEDMNYFPFSRTAGVNANLFLSTYKITTDESIYPIENIVNQTGGVVMNTAQMLNFEVRQDEYLKFYLRKSSKEILVERSFRKADDTLSYIGGLFSAILAVLFLLTLFNEFSFQLEVADNLFHYDRGERIDLDGFHFFTYLGYLIFILFDKIGIKLEWEKMKKYHRSLEEVRQQMDIRLLLSKFHYTQKMGVAILDQPKIKTLYLQQPLSIEQAESLRKDHEFYDKLKEYYFNPDNKDEKNIPQNTQNKNSITPQNGITPKQSSEKEMKIEGEQKTEEEKEKQECQLMIKRMKKYIKSLEEEAMEGDEVSKRILEKVDPAIKQKLLQRFPQQRKFNKEQSKMYFIEENLD